MGSFSRYSHDSNGVTVMIPTAGLLLVLFKCGFAQPVSTCAPQPQIDALRAEVAELKARLATLETVAARYTALEARPAGNLDWVNERKLLMDRDEDEGRGEDSERVKQALLDDPAERFPDGFNQHAWEHHLASSTPAPFTSNTTVEEWPAGIDCRSSQVVVPAEQLLLEKFDERVAIRAAQLLDQCGFVYLDNMFEPSQVQTLWSAFKRFKNTSDAADFKYPVQGEGREEHMLPFASPYNDSYIHDSRLIRIMSEFLRGPFKMELQTIINSKTGSGNQRWHQGWRYLFHPEERLPPYAAVVTMPLVPLSEDMGPTQICPGKKLRFYRGWSCPEGALAASSTLGTVIIFDYKTLHRGPANTASIDRPMLSLVYSRSFFMNGEAIVNRGVPLVQTLHQRRYWESYFWHPEVKDAQMMV